MFEHTRNNRRQTFDRVRSPVLLHDVSDAMGPALDRGGAVRAKFVHALAKSSRALGVDDELPPMRLLDSFGKGAHDSPHTRDYPGVGRFVEADPARVRLECRLSSISRFYFLSYERKTSEPIGRPYTRARRSGHLGTLRRV